MNLPKLILISLFLFGCNTQCKTPDLSKDKISEVSVTEKPVKIYCDSLKGSTGIITLDEEVYKFGTPINILNSDNTVFEKVIKTEEKQIIAYRCTAKTKDRYTILFNDGIKFLSSDDPNLKFYTWEDFISHKVFSIDFDFALNPLRDKKNGKIIPIEKSGNYRISIKSISGNWIQIEYTDFNKEKSTIGWIQWRDEHCLLIELFYFA